MPIRLVLADDSDVMRPAIERLLKDEPQIELVGEATSFAETLQLVAGLKPDVLLLDLHMRDEREYPPELVKSQILLHTKCIVAISLYNDDDARALAESFGAHVLLDKMKLYLELIPAIKQFCPSVSIPQIAEPLGKSAKRPSTPSIVSSGLKVPFVTKALLIFARVVDKCMPPVNFGEQHLDGCSAAEEVKQNGNYS